MPPPTKPASSSVAVVTEDDLQGKLDWHHTASEGSLHMIVLVLISMCHSLTIYATLGMFMCFVGVYDALLLLSPGDSPL